MVPKETQDYIDEIKKFTKEVTASKKKSAEFLAKTGIYSEKGELNPQYK